MKTLDPVIHHSLTDECTPIPEHCRVRFRGENYYFEITPDDDGGISVSISGAASGSTLTVIPKVSNVVVLRSEVEFEERVHRHAVRLSDVWKSNQEFKKKHSIKD